MSPFRRATARHGFRGLVVLPMTMSIALCMDVRFFMAALEGASAATLEETVKPFPSLQIDPYRNIAPHFGVASARAGASRDRKRRSKSHRCIGERPAAAAQRSGHSRGRRHRAEAGNGSRSRRAWRPARRCGFHARRSRGRARRVLRPRRHRRLFPGGRRQPHQRRVRRRHHRVDPPVRPLDTALGRHSRSGRCRPSRPRNPDRPPSSTICLAIGTCPFSSREEEEAARRPAS